MPLSADGVLPAYLLFLCPQHMYGINVESRLLSAFAIIEEKLVFFVSVFFFFKNANSCSALRNSVLNEFLQSKLSLSRREQLGRR